MSLGETLVQRGLITNEQLQDALQARTSSSERLDRVLVRLGYAREQDMLEVLGEQFSIPVIDLPSQDIDVDLLRSMPAKLVHRRKLIPYARHNNTLHVATSDPFDVYALDELRAMTGHKVEAVLASEREINNVIKQYFGVGGEAVGEMVEATDEVIAPDADEGDAGDLAEMAQEATIVRLVNEILREAIQEKASDIHIEPTEHDMKIRYRMDGVLQPTAVPPEIRRFQAAIISRIKIISSLNIAERRLPQDGGFKFRYEGREVDVRVSIIPNVFGEGVVMRILDRRSAMLSLTDLGMAAKTYAVVDKLINLPHGIMLVTGPTGSGKTTTLYAGLNTIVSDRIKVITVEDPVEYHLDGVNQIQVLPKIGYTFARGLRSILRHDPDVIMIGEIRDLETAQAAVQAALTGHLVFSTLHTNDACSAATRLLDMGIEPFLVTSTLSGVMAQRLMRTICPNCKEPYKPNPDDLPPDFEYDDSVTLYRGAGCRECRHSGYKGRVGVFELLEMSEPIREMIMEGKSASALQVEARKLGLITLRDDGWRKVREGMTTPEEVLRVTVGN